MFAFNFISSNPASFSLLTSGNKIIKKGKPGEGTK